MVKQSADDYLADAAQSLLNKINQNLPKHKKELISQNTIHMPNSIISQAEKDKMKDARKAIKHHIVTELIYIDSKEKKSQRNVWPLALAYWGKVWTLACYCEDKQGFRSFRLDRMVDLTLSTHYFVLNEKVNLQQFCADQIVD